MSRSASSVALHRPPQRIWDASWVAPELASCAGRWRPCPRRPSELGGLAFGRRRRPRGRLSQAISRRHPL